MFIYFEFKLFQILTSARNTLNLNIHINCTTAPYKPVVRLRGTNATPRGKKQNCEVGAPIGMWHKEGESLHNLNKYIKCVINMFSQFFLKSDIRNNRIAEVQNISNLSSKLAVR